MLAPNEFVVILNDTKGHINMYVGPHETSLAITDVPVVFNSGTKHFDRNTLDQAIQVIQIDPEGRYYLTVVASDMSANPDQASPLDASAGRGDRGDGSGMTGTGSVSVESLSGATGSISVVPTSSSVVTMATITTTDPGPDSGGGGKLVIDPAKATIPRVDGVVPPLQLT